MTSSLVIGKVYLVGAGPGAADLITVRGARLLNYADVVLHDALITTELLALCPQAIKIFVGKRSGQCSVKQKTINQSLLKYAKKYRIVVRLKGGDPMLFGRADEELRVLASHSIPYEIVPGVTAAVAAAAASKKPLTKRGVARSVSLFTSCIALHSLKKHFLIPNSDTLVQYMGCSEAIKTAQCLLSSGYAKDTPVVIVENCSYVNERILILQLEKLQEGLKECSGPVTIMIGNALID